MLVDNHMPILCTWQRHIPFSVEDIPNKISDGFLQMTWTTVISLLTEAFIAPCDKNQGD
jgi:Na+/H+ antiporter NhaC